MMGYGESGVIKYIVKEANSISLDSMQEEQDIFCRFHLQLYMFVSQYRLYTLLFFLLSTVKLIILIEKIQNDEFYRYPPSILFQGGDLNRYSVLNGSRKAQPRKCTQPYDSSNRAHTFRQYNWLLTSSCSFFRHLIVTNLKIEKK